MYTYICMVLFRNYPGVPEENYKIYCVEYLLWMPRFLSLSSTVLSRSVRFPYCCVSVMIAKIFVHGIILATMRIVWSI